MEGSVYTKYIFQLCLYPTVICIYKNNLNIAYTSCKLLCAGNTDLVCSTDNIGVCAAEEEEGK